MSHTHHPILSPRNPAPRTRLLLSMLVAAGVTTACGGGGGSDAGSGAYAVDTSPTTALPTAAIATTDPAVLATATALMLEMVDEAEDAVDDVDEWLLASSRTCSHGGSVTVTDGTTATGFRSRLLAYADCRDDDDRLEGQILLSCESADCTTGGTIRYGNGDVAFMKQSLDRDIDDLTTLWRGEIRYEGWDARLDTGTMRIDLRQDRADALGPVGAVALTGFGYGVSALAGTWTRSYEGTMASTTFDLARGGCNAPGTTVWSTASPLAGDDDGDRVDAGRLLAAVDGSASLNWTADGQVEAVAAGGATSRYRHSALQGLCDL